MAEKIDEYFEHCDNRQRLIQQVHTDKESGKESLNEYMILDPEPYTMSGLTLALGFCEVKALHDYEKKPEFGYLIKNARTRIQKQDEVTMKEGRIKNLAGIIFLSKVRYGWNETQNVNHSGEVSLHFDKEWKDA